MSFDTVNFNFPSYSKRMLGGPSPPAWTVIEPGKRNSFQLINSTFYGSDGLALHYRGDGVLLKNNLFMYNDWSVANMKEKPGGLGTVISSGRNDKFFRNTMRFNGASNGYGPSKENPLVKRQPHSSPMRGNFTARRRQCPVPNWCSGERKSIVKLGSFQPQIRYPL